MMIKHELLKFYVWFDVTLCCVWFFLNVNLVPKFEVTTWPYELWIDTNCFGMEEVYFVPRSFKSVNRCVGADTEVGERNLVPFSRAAKTYALYQTILHILLEKMIKPDTTIFVAPLESIKLRFT